MPPPARPPQPPAPESEPSAQPHGALGRLAVWLLQKAGWPAAVIAICATVWRFGPVRPSAGHASAEPVAPVAIPPGKAPATKDDVEAVRSEVRTVKSEVREEIKELKEDVRGDIKTLGERIDKALLRPRGG